MGYKDSIFQMNFSIPRFSGSKQRFMLLLTNYLTFYNKLKANTLFQRSPLAKWNFERFGLTNNEKSKKNQDEEESTKLSWIQIRCLTALWKNLT